MKKLQNGDGKFFEMHLLSIVCLIFTLLFFSGKLQAQGGGVDTSGLDTLVPIEEETEAKPSTEKVTPPAKAEKEVKESETGGKVELIEELKEEGKGEKKEQVKPSEKEALPHPSESGFSGLVHSISGDSGDPWSWGVGLHSGFFLKDDFIYDGDTNKYVSGVVTFRLSIWKYFEAGIAIKSYANYNTRQDGFEPPLFQTLGDTSLGLRGFYPVHKGIFLGLAYRAILLNKVGDVGIGAANHELMIPFTADIQKYSPKVPLRIHLNLGWLFDESRKLVEDEEAARAEREGAPCEVNENQEYSPLACISPVERFALGINRNDLFKVGLGLEFPTPYVSPFAEGNIAIAVNRQDFNCGQNMNESSIAQDDYCLAEKGAMAYPINITVGFRVKGIPYKALKGLGILAAADIGVTGIDRNSRVRELAMNPTYMVYLGLSYTSVIKAKEVVKIQEVTRTEIKEPPPKPRIIGKVVDSESKGGIGGAIIKFTGRDLTGLVTQADGSFVSYPLEKGEYEMTISAQNYFDSTCAASLEETGDTSVECQMRPMPKLTTITGQVLDAEKSDPISGASVTFEGPRTRNVSTDASGNFSVEIEAGNYDMKVSAEGYFSKSAKVQGPSGSSVSVQMMLSKKPKKALAVIKKNIIRIGKQIQFEFNSATIKPQSYVILDSVADVIINHPEIQLVEIQGHTDDKGTDEYNMQLSQSRADSVRDYLVSAGVEPDKLVAKGYGKTKPIAPNVTSAGRAKNRRVEFHILQQAGGE